MNLAKFPVCLLSCLVLGFLPVAHAQLTFVFNYTDSNAGFTDPALGAARQAALEEAAQLLATYIPLSSAVSVTFDVSSLTTDDGSTLASASSDYSGTDVGFAPTVAQKKIQTGVDANGAAADGNINWSFFNNWDLDNSISTDAYDFVSTAMHEILHAMGFSSSIAPDPTGGGSFVVGAGQPNGWTTFDQYMVTADGTALVNSQYIFNQATLSAFDDDPGIYFNGPNAVAANGGHAVAIYSPNPWEEGSSGSHTDDHTFTGSNALLMNAATGTGPGVRTLSAIEIGILKDLGYNVSTPGTGGSGGDGGSGEGTNTSRIVNLSVRANASSDTLKVGVAVGGSGDKALLIRVVGPTLGQFGVDGTAPDPLLKVFTGDAVVASNDNWSDTLNASFTQVGAFPLNVGGKDAALVTTLPGGPHPSQVDTQGQDGVVLVEAYDMEKPGVGTARLVNVSALNQVGTGSDVLVAGFVIDGVGSKTVLIRGVGATLGLAPFGIAGVLANPKLEVHELKTGEPNVLRGENDDWNNDATLAATMKTVGAFDLSSQLDSAVLLTLNPGRYSATVSGVNSTTGVAIVEVYEVE